LKREKVKRKKMKKIEKRNMVAIPKNTKRNMVCNSKKWIFFTALYWLVL